MKRNALPWLIAVGLMLVVYPRIAPAGIKEKAMLTTIRMPPGFKISTFTDSVPGARSLAMGSSGVLFVGTRQMGQVYAVLDQNADGKADRVVTIAERMNQPNGVALYEGDLYVAEVSRILRFRKIESRLDNPGPPEVVYAQFPKTLSHGWKFIRFGPDGKLYVPVGAPCNVCLSEDPVFATITRLDRDGSAFEIYTRGVRNTVGFDWHPRTGQLWFTDNGRDWMGDDQPPDELNRVTMPGEHFGFPYCHGGTIADPEFGGTQSCSQFTAPAAPLGPHVAALGMRFYTGRMFPEAYHEQIFIAEHGSWNRSQKIGYRISLVRLKEDKVVAYEPFAQGWLNGENTWGRPVDLEQMADGSLLVSDDQTGMIYRITYEAPAKQ
jgi:glucose/arabinose dehydrogenase